MISRNLALRLLVAAVFIPLFLYVFHVGGIVFLVLVEVLIVLSLWEFFTLTGISLHLWQKLLLILLAAFPAISVQYLQSRFLVESVIALIFLVSLPHVFTRQLGDIGRSMALAAFAMLYLTVGFTSLILIRSGAAVDPKQAAGWVTFLFASIWIIDTAAYYFGWQWGKKKLSPAISPKKTVVGFIGGFGGGILTAGIFNFVFLPDVGFIKLIPPVLVIAFFGQLGDLVESIFKREASVKDSSNLIPGHGGILDRFDSLVFAAPALLIYLRLAA
jgi:phosphatidate cytidylyltransferase